MGLGLGLGRVSCSAHLPGSRLASITSSPPTVDEPCAAIAAPAPALRCCGDDGAEPAPAASPPSSGVAAGRGGNRSKARSTSTWLA